MHIAQGGLTTAAAPPHRTIQSAAASGEALRSEGSRSCEYESVSVTKLALSYCLMRLYRTYCRGLGLRRLTHLPRMPYARAPDDLEHM